MSMAEIVEYFARFYYAWIDNTVKNIEAISPCLYQTVVAHKGEMLGQVGFGKLSYFK